MKFFRITGLFMLYLLLSSKGCDDRESKSQQQEDTELEIKQDSLLAKFSSDILTEPALRAFEENGKQKLADFADYFNIMADTSLDTSFRNQAKKMIRDLFYPANPQLDLTLPGQTETRKFRIDELLNINFLSGYRKPELILDSIRLRDPLHVDKSSGYIGTLSFRQGFKAFSGNEPIAVKPVWKIVLIIAERHPKRFGKDAKEVWEVFLGPIDRINL
jgi:hypothetical protein